MKKPATDELPPIHPAADAVLVSLYQQLGELGLEKQRLESVMVELDEQDAKHFDEGNTQEATARLRRRFETEATLRQVTNRIKGANQAVQSRESELVAHRVDAIRKEINLELDEMSAQAQQINGHLDEVVRGISRLLGKGQTVVRQLRGVRGRSMLATDGHIPAGDITALADLENLRFCLERHMAGSFAGWRTEHGAAGPDFVQTVGSQIEVVRAAIEQLLETEDFRGKAASDSAAGLLPKGE